MAKKILAFVNMTLVLIAIFLLQTMVIDGRELFGVKPNLILITVIVVALKYGVYGGITYSAIIGIVTDLMFGNTYGMFTLCYLITGTVISIINNNYRKENKIALVYVTFIASAIFEVVQYFIYLLRTGVYSNILSLLVQIVLSAILNVILVYIIHALLFKILKYFDKNIGEYDVK